MSKELKLKALELIKKYSVTAYEIEKNTHLSAVGVQKIIDGVTKNPQKPSLDAIISYITNKYEGYPKEEYKSDGKVLENLHEKITYVIPVKGRAGLYNSFYSDQFMETNLETEILHSKEEVSKYSKYFKIEVEGVSMDDGTRKGLCEGDWIYVRSVQRELWKSKLHTHDWGIWVFFHNERGILIKSIKEQNVETGELILESLNPDKKKFPDIKIKVSECTFVCNVVRVEYAYGK